MRSFFSQRCVSLFLLGPCLVVCSLLLSGYTLKRGKKFVDDGFVPPPYMVLVRQALVSKELGTATRFLKAARACWQKRGRACGFRKHTFLVYLGVLTLQRNQARRAMALLQQAKAIWKRSPPATPKKATKLSQEAHKSHRRLGRTLSFYLGQAYFRMKKYKDAAIELRNAAEIVGKVPGYYRLLASAQLRAKRYQSARQTLQKGMKLFPKESSLLQLAAVLYLRVGAWQAALNMGRRLLRATPKSNATSFLLTVDAMRQAGLVHQVLPLLEEARLYMPNHRGIWLRLGIAYSQAQMPIAAAQCFALLAPLEPNMAYFAAAAWMQAGDLQQALRWNQRVKNPRKRVRQYTRILLKQGKLTWAFAVLKQEWKKKTLAPDGRYRLAYVALRLGQYAMAQRLLASLKGTSHATSAQQLQQTLRLCRTTPWRCLE